MPRSHIAILKRPYLELILNGSKRLECRLTRVGCAPFGQIASGEKILLKESAGAVRGEARAAKVLFFEGLTPQGVERIYREHNQAILGAEDFWQGRRDCRYCSLIWLTDVRPVEPYRIKTAGRRGWIVREATT